MTTSDSENTHEKVRKHYGQVARTDGACGCGPGCCSTTPGRSLDLGYTATEIAQLPSGADMGLGCGTPLVFAGLREGEVILDLGSGGGIDCFLAARHVGPQGKVIGVDMTPEMVTKARNNAARVSARNVEFKLGEIEALPLADRSVDVVVSNCVINLSPDKAAVFREAFRVLRPGGRLAISDIVASEPLSDEIVGNPAALVGCIAGAPAVEELRKHLVEAGFVDVSIDVDHASRSFIVAAAAIHAVRPSGDGCCGTKSTTSCC